MFLSAGLSAALDRINERAEDVRRAYTPGAFPSHDDVATPSSVADFTLDPLAVVAPEGAYFITHDGEGRRAYTRDGSFTLRDGKLIDAEGHPIFGASIPGAPITELAVDPVDARLGRVRDIALEPDGSLAYVRDVVNPRSGSHERQRVVAGRVALARFPAATRLETGEGNLAAAPPGITPQTGLANDGNFGPLTAMRRERSRIDVDESLVRLKEAYLAFDALAAAETAKSHLGKTAMDLLK